MSAPRIYGWCPGALRPMMSGDGLVVRVRAPLGRLTQTQAKGIAALSERFGNGRIDLSSRANLQIRGGMEATHPELLDGLRDLKLLDANKASETRRNIIVQPFWAGNDATHRIAQDLTAALAANTAPDLPSKFGFAVDCGPSPYVADSSADIRIENGQNGLICRPDGAQTGMAVTEGTAAQVAIELAQWFLESGGAPSRRGRMADHIERVGIPAGYDARALPATSQPGPGATVCGILVGLEFGQMSSSTLAALADIAPLRLTPWRMLLLEDTNTLPPELNGLVTQPDDPRLRVTACTGAPRCPQGLSATRDIARQLAKSTTDRLHVSGCTKGCAHPNSAPRTLVATAPGRFDLVLNGRASDIPHRRDLSAVDLEAGEL